MVLLRFTSSHYLIFSSSPMSCCRIASIVLKAPETIHPCCFGSHRLRRNGFRCCSSISLSDSETAPKTDSLRPVKIFTVITPNLESIIYRKRIVSGVQPTGSIHLGNYLGAIKNWISLQNDYETLFFIVDLHAITLPYEAQQLPKATRATAAIYLACGVDTSKASVFVQSHVPAHAELMWMLSSATPIGWLNKMIQFKEKSHKMGDENVGVGLLTYPVLMASDILLYQSDLVPVGEDQKQHMELTRDLAERVNYLYGGKKWKKMGGRGGAIFKVPEPLIPPAGARVMSLTDGLSKMSKSAPSDQSRINLLDTKDVIVNKIRRCKTDSFPGLDFDNRDRPECNNLLSVYQLVAGKTKQEVTQECQDMNWGTFKPLLTDALIDHLHPIQDTVESSKRKMVSSLREPGCGCSIITHFGVPVLSSLLKVRYEEIMSDSAYLDRVLVEGASKAADIAGATLNNVRQAMGFLPR
ncbi:hypothetical protein GIB67_027925 [Kingdonia uniflora]|uniref:tryptophan--tRNA ligase n=1 Tax=Kingdonia uniflora TaxID=39325 RepID=A0A7J7LGI4_9MAGN|nr:hypothetical protein GIB67_027925 [Kingdonia uniflora]